MAAELKADGWLVWARDAETLQRAREGFSEVITAISGDADLAREVEFRQFGAAVHGPLDCIVVHRRESAGAGLHQWASGHPMRQGTFGGEPFLFSLVVQPASPTAGRRLQILLLEGATSEQAERLSGDLANEYGVFLRAIRTLHRLHTKLSILDRLSLGTIGMLDDAAGDVKVSSAAVSLLSQFHAHAGESRLKLYRYQEEWAPALAETNKVAWLAEAYEATVGPICGGEREASVFGQEHVTRIAERLDAAKEFTQAHVETSGLNADLRLNQTMMGLTFLTMFFGAATALDKYQSDRTFGISVDTAFHRLGLFMGVVLVLTIFSARQSFAELLRGWGLSLRASEIFFRCTRGTVTSHLKRLLLGGAREQAAWEMFTEHITRVDTQYPRAFAAILAAEGGLPEVGAVNRMEGELDASTLTIAAALAELKEAAKCARLAICRTPDARIRQITRISRYISAVNMMALEHETTLPPIDEVVYWLTYAEHEGVVNRLAIASGWLDREQEADFRHLMPWSSANALAEAVRDQYQFHVSMIGYIETRLDRTAARFMGARGGLAVSEAGALGELVRLASAGLGIGGKPLRMERGRWEHEATANGLSLSDLFRADAAARGDAGRA